MQGVAHAIAAISIQCRRGAPRTAGEEDLLRSARTRGRQLRTALGLGRRARRFGRPHRFQLRPQRKRLIRLGRVGFCRLRPGPAAGSACPIGLGLASCGAWRADSREASLRAAAGGGACSVGAAADAPAVGWLRARQQPGGRLPAEQRQESRRHQNAQQETRETRLPLHLGRGARRRQRTGSCAAAAAARGGAAAVAAGAFTSAIVIAFNRPPRGIRLPALAGGAGLLQRLRRIPGNCGNAHRASWKAPCAARSRWRC